MDRLTSVTGYKANTYTYDAVGNRKSQIKNGSTETYNYSANSNQLVSVGGSSISYNSNGQTQSKLGSSFSYNDENRLSQHTKSGQSTTYSYNALGQRVKKSNSSSTTRFFYDESGGLIAEYLVAENKWKEYIYLHGQVVGFAVNGALYYVHNDHLGRAERITNASKSTVWRANNYDFDRVVAYGSANWYNLGFPGQYYDSEKDSYYNYFRDYDPKTGRYIQSDPIGLAGGINTYGYVSGNPVNYFDPKGLSSCACDGKTYGSPEQDYRRAVESSEQLANRAIEMNAARANIYSFVTTAVGVAVGVAAPVSKVLQWGIGYTTWGVTAATGPDPLYPEDRKFQFLDKHGDHYEVIHGIMDQHGNIKEIHYTEAGKCE